VIERQRARAAAARIERLDLLRLWRVDHRETVTANPRHVWFGDIERRGHCNRRVDGIAAAFQDVDADLRGERLACRHHALIRADDGASRGRPAEPCV
jgi:hypothetical protein